MSKPVAAPFHDGTKCLVRDIATHLERARPTVMSTARAPSFDPTGRVELARVYPTAGNFAPSLGDNLRAAAWLLARAQADVWHFVFAPNRRTSAAGRWLSRLHRVPVLQTVASAPHEFARIRTLLFGKIVVAQSSWTAKRISESYALQGVPTARRARVEVIPPPVAEITPRAPDKVRSLRQKLGIALDAPIFVYPGDLETSSGAEAVAEAVAPLAAQIPGVVVVFAYREKTPLARILAHDLERRVPVESARFVGQLSDVLTLISGARAVLFPVDDLWGKVDLPIVLLEAMSLGVPLVVLDQGPLGEIESALHVAPRDRRALVRAAADLERDDALRERVIRAQQAEAARRFAAPVVAHAYERLYEQLLSNSGLAAAG